MERLVLFDIDGTILRSGGAAARAFRRALEEVFGTSGPTDGYSFAGRTDPQIARDLLSLAGLPSREIDEGLERVWEKYLTNLRTELSRTRVRVLPGVRPLLARLAEENAAVLGLLTGNVLEGARLKLESAAIDQAKFVVGAFGSDHADRRELPAVAIERAERRSGHRFAGKSVVIIGDTPFDISCGAHLGVRTIAVGTGTFSAAELAKHGPDHLFDNLSNLKSVWRAIFD
jgi:phosphoglycolate phosphatase